MPYLVGNLIKEIEAGGPITSFPKSSIGPVKAKENGTTAPDENTGQTASLEEEPQMDWVKSKWARYYELNQMGHIKPNFDKMTYAQFQEYMEDAQAQDRANATAATSHLDLRRRHGQEQQRYSQMTVADRGHVNMVALAAKQQPVAPKPESRPRKKPRVKTYVPMAEYLKRYRAP